MNGAYTIVIVDDEPFILNALNRLFRRIPERYDWIKVLNIKAFISPIDALDFIKTHKVQTVISDYKMLEMEGTDLLTRIKDIQPDATRIIMSGSADVDCMLKSINHAKTENVVLKPWDDQNFVDILLEALRLHDERVEIETLADRSRCSLHMITPKELARRELEKTDPGLTYVERDVDGSIKLDT